MIDLTELCKYIQDNYDKFAKSTINDKELVIFSTGDFKGEYGYGSSDLESWGVDKDGKLYWAFASGCSCYCNTELEEKTIKVFEIKDITKMVDNTDIVKALNLFNGNKEDFIKSVEDYHYSNW